MSPPAVNAPPAPVSTTNRTPSSRVELLEHGRQLVARGHRDAVELPGDVEGDRGHAALLVALDAEPVVLGHTCSSLSSRAPVRRILPDGLFGRAAYEAGTRAAA